MTAKYFHYKILEQLPLTALQTEPFFSHRRLMVFAHKGTVCVTCGLEGTFIGKGSNGSGQIHYDIYAADLTPLTVDHILPVSKGGGNELENLQPMCYLCNNKKGNGDQTKYTIPKSYHQPTEFLVGVELYRKIKKRNKNKFLLLGKMEGVSVNPHTNEVEAVIGGNWYSFKNLYVCC